MPHCVVRVLWCLADLYPTPDGFRGQMMQQQMAAQYRGTIAPAYGFNANRDAEVMRKAMKGIGKDPVLTLASTRTPQ